MGEMAAAWDVTGQLRTLAVELVRDGRSADAMAVLASIGALEMLSTFSGEAGVAGAASPHTPDY
jgi:hypothetical protein